jgi:Alpha-glutamyl/putrescinyl thymine pyrophosphorylase clade 3
MRPKDRFLAQQFADRLAEFNRDKQPLPGISISSARDSFVEQLLESVRRIDYPAAIGRHDISQRRTDPTDMLFDPLRAAILHHRRGNEDEAFWLVFLFVHFGKNRRNGWTYLRNVYGMLGGPSRWDWQRVSNDPPSFAQWLRDHLDELRAIGGSGAFGNHRKYESLAHTGETVMSYVAWVSPPRTHLNVVSLAQIRADGNPRRAFDHLYRTMDVTRFGRTARFDYLNMIVKLGLSAIEPGVPYLSGSSGPLKGARLLFGSSEGATDLDVGVVGLGSHLQVGMDVIEDALCNWQKSPHEFKPHRG